MNGLFEKYMAECPLIAILRGITPAEVPAVCDVLFRAGIRLLEIPLNSPDAFTGIAEAVRHTEGRQIAGAGTVLMPEDAEKVHAAGGNFIVSPNTDPAVIRRTKELGMISIPGFFTATEAFAAEHAGADYLKLFPACLGPSYVKDLKAVVRRPVLAVGGVNAENIPAFMKVCAGVGIGSALYKSGKSLEQIGKDAAAMVRACRG